VVQYEKRFEMIAKFSKNNQKVFFDRIKGEVLDFQELVYRIELMGEADFANRLQKRFDQSMEQFELEEDTLKD
jgi:hypothetical protein